MAPDLRPRVRLRLLGGSTEDGEIRLDDLGKIASETQTLIRRLARGLVGRRSVGRTPAVIERATLLTLVGLHRGSTVLEIAAPAHADGMLEAEGMPEDLGPRALRLLLGAMEVIAVDGTDMPLGFDGAASDDLDLWLKDLGGFKEVEIQSELAELRQIRVAPREARIRLHAVTPAPAFPWVSATDQALSGRLYALNLDTGTFSIEDEGGRKIRLTVPRDLRADAATLVNRSVRAVGKPTTDEAGRLRSFAVVRLEQRPDVEGLRQDEFFARHDLPARSGPPGEHADDWTISGLSDEDVDIFMTTLSDLR